MDVVKEGSESCGRREGRKEAIGVDRPLNHKRSPQDDQSLSLNSKRLLLLHGGVIEQPHKACQWNYLHNSAFLGQLASSLEVPRTARLGNFDSLFDHTH